jgi:uncharacterized membrane protein YvbJ
MICPKCGRNLDLFSEKCMVCGMSFKSMSLAERKKLEAKPSKRKSKPETTPIRMTYDNGIAVGEGMSVTGTKQKRGAHRPFLFKV